MADASGRTARIVCMTASTLLVADSWERWQSESAHCCIAQRDAADCASVTLHMRRTWCPKGKPRCRRVQRQLEEVRRPSSSLRAAELDQPLFTERVDPPLVRHPSAAKGTQQRVRNQSAGCVRLWFGSEHAAGVQSRRHQRAQHSVGCDGERGSAALGRSCSAASASAVRERIRSGREIASSCTAHLDRSGSERMRCHAE